MDQRLISFSRAPAQETKNALTSSQQRNWGCFACDNSFEQAPAIAIPTGSLPKFCAQDLGFERRLRHSCAVQRRECLGETTTEKGRLDSLEWGTHITSRRILAEVAEEVKTLFESGRIFCAKSRRLSRDGERISKASNERAIPWIRHPTRAKPRASH